MKIIVSLLLAIGCLLGGAQAQEEARAALDRVFERYHTLGGAVCVIQNGEVTFTHTYGTVRPGGEAVSPDTLFQTGSISKMVANIGLMQLLEAKQIPLDAKLGDVLGIEVVHPEYPQIAVTLRQLMTHTASLRDGGFYQQALSGHGAGLDEVFSSKASAAFHLSYRPGTKREYSNFGGGLIGSLIERLSGQTLDAYMRENVFEPLEIQAAFQPALLDAGRMADMYRMPEKRLARAISKDETLVTEADWQKHYGFTAGKLVISAPDLCKILIALCDGGVYGNTRILSESAVQEMLTPQNGVGSVACETGHGLFVNIITDSQVQGRTMYGHGGKAYGMLCAAYFDPADRTGVVMLTNGCENGSMYQGVGMLGRAVMRVCYDEIIGSGHEAVDPFAVGE